MGDSRRANGYNGNIGNNPNIIRRTFAMKRKGLVSFLSLLVALLLPLSAMAQSAALDLLSQAKTDG